MKKNFLASIYVALCMLFRSTDVFFRSNLLITFSPFLLITLEHLVGSILFIGKIKIIKKIFSLKFTTLLMLLFVTCGSSVGGIYFFSKAFTLLNPAVVILLQKLQPVWATCLSFLILHERPTKIFWPFALISLIASYILTFQLTLPWHIWQSIALKGSLYALASVFFWGGGTVLGKKLLLEFNHNELTQFRYFGGFIFSATLLLFFSFSDIYSLSHMEFSKFYSVLYVAAIPGVLSIFLFYKGLKTISAIQASFLELIFPICSTMIAWKFLGRPLNQIEILSGIALLVSVSSMTFLKATR